MNPNSSDRSRSFASTALAVAAGAGAVGALYMLFKGTQNSTECQSAGAAASDSLDGQTIHIVTNTDECQQVVRMLRANCREFPVLGFDCEWVHYGGPNGRGPVALLQLSSHQGLCALIRLCEMTRIPQALADLLADPAIVKVGVEPFEDAKLLKSDYNLQVNSTLDLQILAVKCDIPAPHGLARLAEVSLGVKLDKDWQVRGSNWEADELSERQIKYAANDAHVAVELFRTYAEQIVPRSIWTDRQTWATQAIAEFKQHFDRKFSKKR